MLYKLLEATPSWFFTAVVHGWVHPVTNAIQIHDSGTLNVHIDLDLNADYRLRFRPHNLDGQNLELEWESPPPTVVAGKRITRFTFDDTDQVPRLTIVMGPDTLVARVVPQTGSLGLPIDWRVEESHDGLWRACTFRAQNTHHIDKVQPLS